MHYCLGGLDTYAVPFTSIISISNGPCTAEALRECIPYLDIAENDYAALGMYHSLQDVQFLLSVVYHNLDMTEKRDKVAERHREVGKQKEEAEKQVFEPWIAEVLDIVADISTTLASRSLL